MNKQIKLVSMAMVLAMSVFTLGQVSAEEAPAKPAKAMSCKQQAKKIKDKKERTAFVKECKAKKAETKK